MNKSLYKDKIQILCDRPSEKREGGVKDFLSRYKDLKQNNQIVFLASCSLEECYPAYEDWRRTSDQVKSMSGMQKKQLAKKVGNQISKRQFETEMAALYAILNATWDKAF